LGNFFLGLGDLFKEVEDFVEGGGHGLLRWVGSILFYLGRRVAGAEAL
jgi:hypothetical protein